MLYKNYENYSDIDKKQILNTLYVKEKKSFSDIAELLHTYSNKIRRDAIKYKIPIRNKSEAQSNAIKTGAHKHPTKGTSRSDDTKSKIGLSVMKSWEGLSAQEIQKRKQTAKELWDNLTDDEKQYRLNLANKAVRDSSKTGSKLELYLLDRLLADGFKVDFHKEQMLLTTKLQIDLFLPTMNIAIEIDGPSHFLPVWGDDTLKRNQKYDNKKSGLILGKGLKLIRIKQLKDFSKSRADKLYDLLISVLNDQKAFDNTKIIEIED
jgi:very-short-patch-repair endonuclease